MKKITSACFFLLSFVVNSQNISFGPVVGANFYDIEVKGPVTGGTGGSYFNFGGFFEYKLNNRFGVKPQLIYTNSQENQYWFYGERQNNFSLFSSAELKTIQLHALCKFDLANQYNKGFYLLGGFRLTNVLDVKINSTEDLSDFYEEINYGAMFGFGTTFLKNFSVEIVGDFGLGKTIAYTDYKSKNNGAYFNLAYNLAPIFNKNK